MEKRRAPRITYGIKATLIGADVRLPVLIDNFSENGLNLLTDPFDENPGFTEGMQVGVEFEPEGGQRIVIEGRIAWIHPVQPGGRRLRIGIEAADPEWERVSFLL